VAKWPAAGSSPTPSLAVGPHDEGLDAGHVGVFRQRRGSQEVVQPGLRILRLSEHLGQGHAPRSDVAEMAAERIRYRQDEPPGGEVLDALMCQPKEMPRELGVESVEGDQFRPRVPCSRSRCALAYPRNLLPAWREANASAMPRSSVPSDVSTKVWLRGTKSGSRTVGFPWSARRAHFRRL